MLIIILIHYHYTVIMLFFTRLLRTIFFMITLVRRNLQCSSFFCIHLRKETKDVNWKDSLDWEEKSICLFRRSAYAWFVINEKRLRGIFQNMISKRNKEQFVTWTVYVHIYVCGHTARRYSEWKSVICSWTTLPSFVPVEAIVHAEYYQNSTYAC